MAFGKIYGLAASPRVQLVQVAAKYEGLELELVETNPFAGVSAEYKEKFPLGLIPAFEAGDFKLTECTAIANNNKAGLLGASKEDAASVNQWTSWANTALMTSLGPWIVSLVGLKPYNKANVEAAKTRALDNLAYLEKYLASTTFLVGERITLADIYVTIILSFGFSKVLDAEVRATLPNTVRFFNTVVRQTNVAAVVGEPTLIEKAIVYTPPKKEEKKKEAPKPKEAAKPAADEEEVAAEAPKPKHPCEALPKPAFPLDEFKRQYSNNETVDAMKWLDEHYNANDYSIVKATFKYPEELTQVFMSSNLITGLHTRLEASRKFLFGNMAVYGTANDSLIVGVYMIRGNSAEDIFNVAPDWESYTFETLDYKTDRKFIEENWSWEGSVNGKPFADGKTFK
ncbi:translation elongation factor EF1B gamma [Sporobolomyces koalae]|uniref:translation elongation factor EF1B gamma n=1 Tax=Sporobolomyces koalae TaxID=500713 RepID=UPI00316C67A5